MIRFLFVSLASLLLATLIASANPEWDEGRVLYNNNYDTCGPAPITGEVQRENAKALLIGIDDYADPLIIDLDGTINDVCLMRYMLVRRYGFKDKNIKLLTNERAYKSAIISALKSDLTPKSLSKSDVVFFYYAGHGGQLSDDDGDEAGFDGLDETIVAYDTELLTRNDIRDDTLEPIFSRIADLSASLTVVFDACHSGDALRSSLKARRIERNEQPSVREQSEDWSQALDRLFSGHDNLVFMSAASEKELANEDVINGKTHGAFTHAFYRAASTANSGSTSRDILERARILLSKSQIARQTPTIEGDFADSPFLSQEVINQNAGLLASTIGKEDRSSWLSVPIGEITGETKGSIYSLEDPAEPTLSVLATVREVGEFQSVLRLSEGTLPAGSYRALLHSHAYERRTPKLFFATHNDRFMQQLHAANMKDWMSMVPIGADYILLPGSQPSEYVLASAGGKALTTISDEAELPDLIEYWEKWSRFLEIEHSSGLSLVEAGVHGPQCKLSGRYKPTKKNYQVCTTEGATEPRLSVKNSGRSSVWVNFVAVNPSGSINLLGAPRQIEAGRLFKTPPLGIKSVSGKPETTIIKVFASKQRVDLSAFEQNLEVRSEKQNCLSQGLDDLNHLLCSAAGKRSDYPNVRSGEWSVTDLAITVSPRK